MELSFTTSPKGFEAANCLLRIGIDTLNKSDDLAKDHGVEPIHIYEAMIFRKKMVDAFKRTAKNARKIKSKTTRINQWKAKAEKWDTLSERIAACYVKENEKGELVENNDDNIDLLTIGEIAASAFGWI